MSEEKFIKKLGEDITESRNIKASSLKVYLFNIEKLHDKIFSKRDFNNQISEKKPIFYQEKSFLGADFLKQVRKIMILKSICKSRLTRSKFFYLKIHLMIFSNSP